LVVWHLFGFRQSRKYDEHRPCRNAQRRALGIFERASRISRLKVLLRLRTDGVQNNAEAGSGAALLPYHLPHVAFSKPT
jgi:hypothetical protein